MIALPALLHLALAAALAAAPTPTDAQDSAFRLLPNPGAQSGSVLQIEDLLRSRRASDPQVSPDGQWVAFTLAQYSLEENRSVKDVWVASVKEGHPRPFTEDGYSEHARWSPDGKKLLVVSGRAPPHTSSQLYLFDLARGGDPEQLTHLWGGADGGLFAPDGKTVAFTSEVYAACAPDAVPARASADLCNRKQAAELAASGLKARVVTHLFARHWNEWKDAKRRHLFVLPLTTAPGPASRGGPAEPKDLTPGDADWPTWRGDGADDYSFTSDGHLIVSAKPAAKEAWSTNSDLWELSLAGGTPKNLTASNPGDDASPRVSPDGRWVAYRSQARDGSEADRWRLKLLDRKTGAVRLLGDVDGDAGVLLWNPDARSLVVSLDHHGRTLLQTVSLLDGTWTPRGDAPVSADFDLSRDGTVVAVLSALNRPPELFAFPPGSAPRALSDFNGPMRASRNLGPVPQEVWVPAADGNKIHAWVMRPPKRAARSPLLVLIHGGPQGAWEDSWSMRWNAALFASRGYVVVMPNPRGSSGYGRAFEEGVSKDWGGKAYDDIIRVTDAAESWPFVEKGHTCAAGASFGGYMVNWIAGHTDRFRCLVSHDGVFDLISMYGSTEELWFPEFEVGLYWESPALYRKLSPSSYVQNFKTPTLVVEGELDFRVPADQALGMFTALQRRGIESRLLWFPDEGHWVLKPRNSRLWYQTVQDWVDAHAKAATKTH